MREDENNAVRDYVSAIHAFLGMIESGAVQFHRREDGPGGVWVVPFFTSDGERFEMQSESWRIALADAAREHMTRYALSSFQRSVELLQAELAFGPFADPIDLL